MENAEKIYRPFRNESTEDYKRKKNTNLEFIYNKSDIKYFLKAKHLEWVSHDVGRAEGSIIQKVLINKSTDKHPRGRPL